MLEPAVLRRRLEHGVLAAHLVGEGRYPERVLDPADDVQVRHSGFDHHHVRAFGNVHRHLAQGFVAIAGVHLVDLLVPLAQVGGRAHRVTERSVERARVFGAVGHDAGVNEVVRLQRLAYCADTAVHHVAGRDDIHAGPGLCERLLHQQLDRLVVEDVPVGGRIGIDQAILPVAREGVECHVRHDAERGEFTLERTHHPGHQAFGVERLAPVRRLERRIDHRKHGHYRNAQLDTLPGHRQQQVQAQPIDARHGRDGLAPLAAIHHEYRIDEVMRAEAIFTHEVARKAVAAQTSWAAYGVVGERGEAGHLDSFGLDCCCVTAKLGVENSKLRRTYLCIVV